MEINQWKIKLVKALLDCDDPNLLEAVEQLLNLHAPPVTRGIEPPSTDSSLDQDTLDLQQSIDDLFEPERPD